MLPISVIITIRPIIQNDLNHCAYIHSVPPSRHYTLVLKSPRFKVIQARETSDAITTVGRIKSDLIIIYSTLKNSEDKLKMAQD